MSGMSNLQKSLVHLHKDIHGSRTFARARLAQMLCPVALALQANFNNATFERVAAEEAMGDAEPSFDLREARFDVSKHLWNKALDEFNAHQADCPNCHWHT